jgi:hypothetical protein
MIKTIVSLACVLLLTIGIDQDLCAQQKSRILEDGGTGQFKAVMLSESSLPTHNVFRSQDLSVLDKNNELPIIAWGNGACANSPWERVNFLNEVASHGFLVIAIGPMPEEGEKGKGKSEDPSQLIDAINWAIASNSDKKRPSYKKVDVRKISLRGMSCGGLQTLAVSPDPRITTTVVCNSGILPSPGVGMPGMPNVTKDQLKKLHTPTLYLLGGESDIAYNNGMDDYRRIDHLPVLLRIWMLVMLVPTASRTVVNFHEQLLRGISSN